MRVEIKRFPAYIDSEKSMYVCVHTCPRVSGCLLLTRSSLCIRAFAFVYATLANPVPPLKQHSRNTSIGLQDYLAVGTDDFR